MSGAAGCAWAHVWRGQRGSHLLAECRAQKTGPKLYMPGERGSRAACAHDCCHARPPRAVPDQAPTRAPRRRRSYGRVYKGRWRSGTVAIKVIAHDGSVASQISGLRESLHAPQRGAPPPPAPRRAGPGPPPQPPGTVRPCHGRRRLVARALLPARMPEAPTPCSRGAPVRTTSEDQAASSPHLAGVWGRRRRDAHAEPPERRRGPDPTLPAAARRCRRTRCTRSTRARPQRAA